jgi:two-component system, LytTR family, response regulator
MSTASPCRTLIVEDEPLAAQGLAEWVRALPSLDLLGLRHDGHSALEAIRELQPQLVLMDIQMPGATGLDVLRALAADSATPMPLVIFTTAYDEHAVTAFELHAVDYLLKPFTQERFNEAIDHALAGRESPPDAAAALQAANQAPGMPEPLTRLLVRDRNGIVPVMVADIEHLKSDTKYTAVTAKGRSHLVRLPITSFEQRLDGQRFLKVNRSCIVNLDFVESMTPDESSQFVIRMRDGSTVTASRDVSKQLRTSVL